MALTKNGIEYDLEITPYRYTNDYGYTFHFSSKTYLHKFSDKHEENRVALNQKTSIKYGVDFDLNLISDIHYYSQLETRGFYIVSNNNEVITSKANLKYVGKILIN